MQTYGDVYLSMTLHLPIKMTPVVLEWLKVDRVLALLFSPRSQLVYETKVDSGRKVCAAVVPPVTYRLW